MAARKVDMWAAKKVDLWVE
jgi:hypothetical protein